MVYSIPLYCSLDLGVAVFGNAPSAIVPAVALIALIGGMSGYCFSMIGRVCAYTGASSYREAWVKSVGEGTSLLPALSVTMKTACAVLAYRYGTIDVVVAFPTENVSNALSSKPHMPAA